MSKSKQIATTEDMMALLHKMTGDSYLAMLKSEQLEQDKIGTMVDYGDGEGEVPFEYIPMLSPAWMTVIQKFLSDSNITCNVENSSESNELKDKMTEFRSKRKNILDINKAVNE